MCVAIGESPHRDGFKGGNGRLGCIWRARRQFLGALHVLVKGTIRGPARGQKVFYRVPARFGSSSGFRALRF